MTEPVRHISGQTLGAHCLDLAAITTNAATWAQNNAEVVRLDLEGLQKELRRCKRAFMQCARAAERKMCAGVFGPSQAGKSYLISALARDRSGGLQALFGEQTHDFISEINPEGGKESTGLVTRFTMTRPDALPPGYPVQIRLLTETDLVKIIANTYYADCEHKEEPDDAAITGALDAVQARQGTGAAHIDLDALEDLQEYLTKNFQAKPRMQALNRVFWPRALELGQKLGLYDRAKLYSLIWDEIPQFTDLLCLLLQALEKLEYAADAFCGLDALIPRNGSIIDVAMLAGLGENAAEPELQICNNRGGKPVALPRSVVTALTAELTIVMDQMPDDYFEHTDLLDFPGYRSRYKFSDVRKELEKSGMSKELFLRGKVAYLFQRYCAEKELTSMLLCIGPSNQEVQDLPGVINDWIFSTHGSTPEVRKGKDVALFFVLTKFDMEFEDKAGAPSVESRWDNRLHASLLDFFGKQHDWPHKWDGETANNKFRNLFLLRNPNFKFKTVLEYDETDDKTERGIRPDAQKLVDALHSAFLNSQLVAQHFVNPEASWEAAMRLNDGGIDFLRNALRPLCNPAIKQAQLLAVAQDYKQKMQTRLGVYYKTDDKEEDRRQKEIFARELLAGFAHLLQNQRLGEFLQNMVVRDQDLYDLYFEARRRFLVSESDAEEPDVNIGDSVKAVDAFAELFGDEALPVPASSDAQQTDVPVKKHMSEAEYFTELILGSWCDRLNAFSDDPVVHQYYGLPAKNLSRFIGELVLGVNRLKLADAMKKSMEKAAAYANIAKELIIWQQVGHASAILNNYTSWLNFNPRERTAKERAMTMLGKQYVLFEPPVPVRDFPQLPEIQPPFEKTWCMDWMRAVYALMMDNIDFDGERNFDREQNTLLGNLLVSIHNRLHPPIDSAPAG
ncbi:MAG: putative virulence factor [Desulfovibrio sp.]|jgi:hypothetical protein|nr:putative virulence factor [Desulfovibrio sp.]